MHDGTHSISIRQADLARREDQEAVRLLLDQYAREPVIRGRPLEEAVMRRVVDGIAQTPGSLVLIGRVGDEPAALAICFTGFSTFQALPVLNVHDFCVSSRFQGRGLGRKMMEEVASAARTRGCGKITLEVVASNERARELYRRCGFEVGDGPGGPTLFCTKVL